MDGSGRLSVGHSLHGCGAFTESRAVAALSNYLFRSRLAGSSLRYGTSVSPAVVAIAILSVFFSAFLRGEDAPASKAVTVPPMEFKHSSLPNGLEVYTVEDHSAPIVAVQVWYHVGSKDDPSGRSGFAHLFEHMMFKGNEHMKEDAFDNLTENIGGENNAYTADDVTVYHETVPSNYLNPILLAEAERMSALALNDKNFASEREGVKEENRHRIPANPYGEFYHDIE